MQKQTSWQQEALYTRVGLDNRTDVGILHWKTNEGQASSKNEKQSLKVNTKIKMWENNPGKYAPWTMKQVKQISIVAFYHLNLLNLKSAINIKGYTKLVVNSVLPI